MDHIETVVALDAFIRVAGFVRGGTRAVLCCENGTVYVCDVRSGRATRFKIKSGVRYADFSPDGNEIIAAYDQTNQKRYSLETGQFLSDEHTTMSRYTGSNEYLYSPNSRYFVTFLGQNIIFVYDMHVAGPHEPARLEIPGHQNVYSARFSPDGRRLFVAQRDGTIAVIDTSAASARDWRLTGRLDNPVERAAPNAVMRRFQMAMSQDGSTLCVSVIASRSHEDFNNEINIVRVYKFNADGSLKRSYEKMGNNKREFYKPDNSHLTLSPKGSYAAEGFVKQGHNGRNEIHIYDTATWSLRRVVPFEASDHFIMADIMFSADTRKLYFATSFGNVKFVYLYGAFHDAILASLGHPVWSDFFVRDDGDGAHVTRVASMVGIGGIQQE